MYICNDLVKRQQFMELTAKASRSAKIIESKPCQNDHLFKGDFSLIKLRDNLTFHSSDGVDIHDLTMQTEVSPRINFALFLQGQCNVYYGERKLTLGTQYKHKQSLIPEATWIAIDRSELFKREAKAGRYLRKLVISIPPEWLENSSFAGLDGYQHIMRFCRQHLATERYLATSTMQRLADRLLNPPDYPAFLRTIHIEGLVLEMVSEALLMLTDEQKCVDTRAYIHPYARNQVNKTLELLDNASSLKTLSLDVIAKEVGTNTNTLQRHFKFATGMTVFEYLRCRNLTAAKSALENNQVNVLEAALLAGYSGTANFSTAFKKQFGVTPNQVRSKIYKLQ